MEKSILKRNIIDAFILHQKNIIATIENAVSELREVVTSEEDAGFGGEAEAKREENMDLLQRELPHLDHARHDLTVLKRLSDHLHLQNTIGEGAVIMTDKQNLVVSVSSPIIKVHDNNYIGISQQAPIYQLLEGKKVGDVISNGKVSFTITDIF